MQNVRRVKKRKAVEVHPNIEQLAQEKLLEISILADDRYEDESKLLAVEDRIVSSKPVTTETTVSQEVKNLIGKKRASVGNRIGRYNSKRRASKELHSPQNIPKQLFLCNKLESNSVFVGFKSNQHPIKHPLNKEAQYLFLERRKRAVTCITPCSFEQPWPVRWRSYTETDALESLMIGESSNRIRKTRFSRSIDWKTRQKNKYTLEEARQKMRATIFSFHRNTSKPYL